MREAQLKEKIEAYTRRPYQGSLTVYRDTSKFMDITAEDILELGKRYYLVLGDAVEGRFGIDDQPKFWVKKTVDLETGRSKIIKLVFNETFTLRLGDMSLKCVRSPLKEARILELTRDDPDFMEGVTVHDAAGNPVRIIDKILGPSFYTYINRLEMDHKTYFYGHFPDIFERILKCVHAINRLHRKGEIHGDIRNDHILIDRERDAWRWIDFDYSYEWAENPFGVDMFGLGNILLFAVGKGFYRLEDISSCAPAGMELDICLEPADLSLFFRNRVMNLKKLFPYIPESLNYVLMHFSQESDVFYENAPELMDDLNACRRDLSGR